MSTNIEFVKQLLDQFESIYITESVEPTFFEITRFPHYENVCSNVLSFFLDNSESHNLNDMMINALLDASETNIEYNNWSQMEVNREVTTIKGNRIDIVVETENLIVGIENKINADAYNDFDDYSSYINQKANDKETIKLVLSLYPINSSKLSGGFINITYNNLFNSVEKFIGNYIIESNHKYLSYLMDFITSIKRLERGSVMNKEIIDFLSEREDDINNFLELISNMRKELRAKIEELGQLIEYEKYGNIKQAYYRELYGALYDTLVHDIRIDDQLTIAIDTVLSSGGWYIDVFPRRKTTKFDDYIIGKNIKLVESHSGHGRKMIEDEFKYQDNLELVADRLNNLIASIIT